MEALLIIVAGTSGAMLLHRWYGKLKLRRAGVVEVNVTETEQLVEGKGALVVDVREQGEYYAGRIPRSRHLPLSQIRVRMGELERERDRPIIVSCRSGRRSAYASILLSRCGYSKVYNLKGGLNAWMKAERKVER